jgi:hypothetical protein
MSMRVTVTRVMRKKGRLRSERGLKRRVKTNPLREKRRRQISRTS